MKAPQKLTKKQYLAIHPEKYVMVTYEFGAPVYIAEAETNGLLDIGVTNNAEDAIKFSAIDNTPNKLAWYSVKTGYKNLVWEEIKTN